MTHHAPGAAMKRAVYTRVLSDAELLFCLRRELAERRGAISCLSERLGASPESVFSGYELKRLYKLLEAPQDSYKDEELYVMPVDKAEKLLAAAEEALSRNKATHASSPTSTA